MLTRDQVLEAIKTKAWEPRAFDSRDIGRLTFWFPQEDWPALYDCELKETQTSHDVRPWTREAILKQLAEDVEFGFEKALNKRGISASCMYGVVLMWMWILEDPLAEQPEEAYAQYGLPLFKAVAVKYSLFNPIGGDAGTENKYSDKYQGGDE